MYKLIRVTKSKIVIHTVKSFGVDNKVSESEIAQSCPTLCDPMDCSLPGSSVHGILQARVLDWGAMAFSSSMAKGTNQGCIFLTCLTELL